MRLCSCPLASPALQALAHPVLGHTGFLQSLPKALALPLLENRIALEDAHLHPAVTTSRPQLLGTPREILEPFQLLCPAILAQLPPQSRPRSPAEPGGTKGFNTFFVAAKFKTLYHHKHSFIWAKPSRGAFYYPGLLNKNFPIMRRVDLHSRLRGTGEPPPGYQPRDGAASISAGDYLILSPCEASHLLGPPVTEEKSLLWASLLGEHLLAQQPRARGASGGPKVLEITAPVTLPPLGEKGQGLSAARTPRKR